MADSTIPFFIVIDDDAINNFICRKTIQKSFTDAQVLDFTDPESGLEYISRNCGDNGNRGAATLLFLDINMPVVNGWGVLDALAAMPCDIPQQYVIYMLSSSIAVADKQKAEEHPLVSGYIEKPLTVGELQKIYDRHVSRGGTSLSPA